MLKEYTEEELQKLYDVHIAKGRAVPTWVIRQMESYGMGDKINGQDDGEPPAQLVKQGLEGY